MSKRFTLCLFALILAASLHYSAFALTTDLSVAITSQLPANPTAGSASTISTSFTVSNSAGGATTGTLSLTVPTNAAYQSLTVPTGWVISQQPVVNGNGAITVTSPTLNASTTTTPFTLVLKVPSNGTGALSVSPSIAIVAGNTDSNASNNSATTTTTIATSADMAITLTGAASYTSGNKRTVTVTLTNNGPSDSPAVT